MQARGAYKRFFVNSDTAALLKKKSDPAFKSFSTLSIMDLLVDLSANFLVDQ